MSSFMNMTMNTPDNENSNTVASSTHNASCNAMAVNNVNMNTSPTIKKRLQQAKKTIRDVTNQTLKSVESQSTVIDGTCASSSYHYGNTSTSTNNDNNNSNDNDDKFELDLAMSLFGDDVTSICNQQNRSLVNEEIQEKLSSIESQLSIYHDCSTASSKKDQYEDGSKMDYERQPQYSNEFSDVDFSALIEQNSSFITSSGNSRSVDLNSYSRTNESNSNNTHNFLKEGLQQEVQDLKCKIHFLQKCTEARIALDDIDAYSMMDNLNVAVSVSNSSGSDSCNVSTGTAGSDNTYSLTRSGDRHYNTNNTTTASKAVLVPIATCISKAQMALNEAEQYIKNRSLIHNKMDKNQTSQPQPQSKDLQIANQIIESIRIQIIRHIVDLDAKVSSIIDACIQISDNQITICNGVTTTATIADTDTNIDTNPTGTNNGNRMISNYEGLNVAFHVLSILSEPHFDTCTNSNSTRATSTLSNDKLSTTLHSIAHEIKQKVIKPKIHDLRSCLKKGIPPKTFTFSEHKSTSSSGGSGGGGIGIGLSSLSGSKKLKKTHVTFEWNEVVTTEAEMETNMDIDQGEKMEEENTLHWWSELLLFIQSIVVFVNKSMLFEQDHLSSILGTSLFLEEDTARSFMRNSSSRNDKNKHKSRMSKYNYSQDKYDNGSVMKLLVDLLEDSCIPNAVSLSVLSKLPNMAKVIEKTSTAFEMALFEHKLLHQSYHYKLTTVTIDNNHQKRQLSHSAKSFMITYAQKQRMRILSQGRKLLLDQDFHDTMKVGVAVSEKQKLKQPSYFEYMLDFPNDNEDMSVFVLHEQKISIVASEIMKLCIKTMDLAVDTDFTVDNDLERLMPPMLYRAAREVFDLYRAIIPATHGHEIATIPRTTAVLHNDCVYFAHKMLSLGLEYKDRFTSLITSDNGGKREDISPMKCTFIDLVPTFRELAERTMNDMIKYQMNQLSEVVCPRIEYMKDALRENEGVVEWTDAKTALQAGLYHLRHLSQSWWNILSYDVYCRAMGNLVDTLYSFYLEEVLKAKDISEPACHFVDSLFRDAIRGTAELFAINEEFEESLKEATKHCKLWKKFDAIGRFMNMSIADINMNLSEGTFREVTGTELSRLVIAVYQDSEKRRQLLHLLANH